MGPERERGKKGDGLLLRFTVGEEAEAQGATLPSYIQQGAVQRGGWAQGTGEGTGDREQARGLEPT